jgi:endo-1,4-beta-xylanase
MEKTDAIQLAAYKRIFTTFWEHPAVKGVTLWGFRPGMWRTDQRAFLVNSDGTEREAMTWLRNYLRGFLSADDNSKYSGFTIYPNPVSNGEFRLLVQKKYAN